MCYLMTELISTLDRERQCLLELDKLVPIFVALLAGEGSLRAHIIQAKESAILHISPTIVTRRKLGKCPQMGYAEIKLCSV